VPQQQFSLSFKPKADFGGMELSGEDNNKTQHAGMVLNAIQISFR
jgi:hypothetical protein